MEKNRILFFLNYTLETFAILEIAASYEVSGNLRLNFAMGGRWGSSDSEWIQGASPPWFCIEENRAETFRFVHNRLDGNSAEWHLDTCRISTTF